MEREANNRILIIDDNRAIHEDFRKILSKENEKSETINQLKALLFEEEAEKKFPLILYNVDSAYQGEEGIEMIKKALKEEQPYAMAFVDVIMPPGINGVETIKKIWEIDSEIQIAICTAHNDYSWEDIVKTVGINDSLLIVKKPFDLMEIRQIACCLTKKWNLNQQVGHQYDKLHTLLQQQVKKSHESLRFES